MTVSEIVNILLGGGVLALVVGVITLKATVRKANAEAEKAKADAESVRITNTEHATRILVENIVKPLKEELNATRIDMHRLRKAVESAIRCRYFDGCPVLRELRDNQKDSDGTDSDSDGREARYRHRNKTDSPGDSSSKSGPAVNIRGQPP